MNDKVEILTEAFIRVMNKVMDNQKRPRKYGSDELLYPSEIHTIMMIGNNEGIHVSELARIAGVTKGAVSQIVGKLAKKGLARKLEDPGNASKILLELTNKGKVAFYSHERMHEEMDAPLFEYLRKLTDKEMQVMLDILSKLEKMADRLK